LKKVLLLLLLLLLLLHTHIHTHTHTHTHTGDAKYSPTEQNLVARSIFREELFHSWLKNYLEFELKTCVKHREQNFLSFKLHQNLKYSPYAI